MHTRRMGLILAGLAPLLVNSVSANSVIGWGRQVLPAPEEMAPLTDVAAGYDFNVGLKPGGEVIVWGSNNYRQATTPENLNGVSAIAAGSTHALALREDGTVAAWGNDNEQQATVPEGLREVVAIDAGVEHSLALHENGAISAWGSNRYGQLDLPEELEEVAAISAGLFHSLAVRKDGTVVAWGLDDHGQSSVPEDLADVVEVAAGGYHSLARLRDGTVTAWGNDDFGQASPPEQLGRAVQIAAGEDHSMVLLEDGRTIVWGRNHYGQVTAPADLTQGRRIAAGSHHSLLLLEDGSVAAWGRNDSGQSLTPGDLSNIVALSAWENHTVALREDGTVFWWGANLSAGIQPDRERLQDVVAVAAGRAHGLALRKNGTVIGWGDNHYGQASPPEDLSSIVSIAAGEFHSLALRSDGQVFAWGNNFQGQVNVPRGLEKVTAIAAGQEHSAVIRQGGMVFAWGNNFYGQRKIPSASNNSVAIAAGHFHNLALGSDGTVAAWGSDFFGEASVPPGLSDAAAAAASRSHSVVIRENRTVVAWGGNHYGQSTIPPDLENVVAVAAGGSRTVVVTGDLQPPRFVTRLQSMSVSAGEDVFILPLIQGTAPLLYQWMKDGNPIPNANGPALSLSRVVAEDSGSYSLIVANPAGNSSSHAFSIEVDDPAVDVNVSPKIAVLEESATFVARAQGSGPFRYQWKKNGEEIPDATDATLLLESVHEEDTGIYAVEVSNEIATVTSDPIQFWVEPRIAEHPPETAAARIGERLTLRVAASGSPPLRIQWLRDGLPMEGATKETLVLENIEVDDGGRYSAIVSNPVGRVKSETTLLQIIPHIVFQPEPQVFSDFGGTAVFEARAAGTPPLTYEWMRDGQPLARTPDPRLVLHQVQASDAGQYHVIVSNPAGKVESERASLMLPPALTRHPASMTVRAGENVEFSVRATGTPPLLFQWLKDGEPVEGASEGQLQLAEVDGSDSARYSVAVSNEVGSVTSQEAMLSISPSILAPPAATTAAPGEEVTLRVEAEGTQPLYFQWTKDGNILPDASGPALTFDSVAPSDAGFYSVIVSNSAGIAVSENAAVEVR